MNFHQLPLPGAYRITLSAATDERGSFLRRFCAEEFRANGLEQNFVQRSISVTRFAGTIRGMHFQAFPHLETKLVRCMRGAAFDVMVDLRRNSSTYGRWHAETLDADNRTVLYIPAGFAHGFQTLADETEIDYEISPSYVRGAERGFRYSDPRIAIPWPLANIIISDRDKSLPLHDGILLQTSELTQE